MDENLAQQLRAPFEPEKIGKLPRVTCGDCSDKNTVCQKHKRTTCPLCKAYVSTSHMHLDFVGHADVTDRLLAVDPEWNWEPLAFNDTGLPVMDGNNGMWVKLTVAGVTRLGYGHAGQKRGGDAIKEIIGDAIRNGAMRFGVALDLWRKESPVSVDAEPPERQVERPKQQTTREQCNELRGHIRLLAGNRGWTITQIGDDYANWSQGRQILAENDPKLLQGYLMHFKEAQNGGSADASETKVNQAKLTAIHAALNGCGVVERTEKLTTVGTIIGRRIESSTELTEGEAKHVLNELARISKSDDQAAALGVYLAHLEEQAHEGGA